MELQEQLGLEGSCEHYVRALPPTWGGGELVAVGGKVALLPIPLGTADFLVHHIHAFTIHVTVLILLKGVLFARSSRLIPDKANLGFRFPFDTLPSLSIYPRDGRAELFFGFFIFSFHQRVEHRLDN